MAKSVTFTDRLTVISADWLNFVNSIVNAQPVIGMASNNVTTPPLAGNTGDYFRNGQRAILGPAGAQYIIDGWTCTLGGNPATWAEIRLPVVVSLTNPPPPPAPGPPAPPPPPAPAPGPAPTPSNYSQRQQAELLSGATLSNSIAGYDGTGYAEWATTAGVTLTATFTGVPSGNGTFTINIRYFNYGDEQNTVKIDSLAGVSYMFTKSYPNWSVLTIPNVTLAAGTHTISLISEWAYTYWDYIEIIQNAAPVAQVTSSLNIGPYNANLPNPGPAAAPAPTSTDNSGATTINNLITAAGTNGTVSIPSGNYIITTPILPLSGQTIQPVSGAGVVIKAGNGYTGLVVNMTGLTNVTWNNISFDGNYTNRTAQEGVQGASCIQISGGSGHSIYNCDFKNCPSYPIWTYNCNGLSIRLNTGTDNYEIMRIDGNSLANTGLVEGNRFINTNLYKSYMGIEALNTNALKIKSNTITGFALQVPTSHGFEGTWGNGIYITASDNYLIENNICGQSYWSSCVCGSGCTNGTVQYNSFERGANTGGVGSIGGAGTGNATQAFWYEQVGSDVITVTRNTFNGGVSIGDTGGDHATVTYNIINCDSTGIDVNSGCNVATILDNTVTSRLNATQNGVFLWEKKTTAANIRCQRNVFTKFLHGVFINNSGATGTIYNLNVTGNTYLAGTDMVNYPNTLTVDASCVLQGYNSIPNVAPFVPFGSRYDGAYPYGLTVTGYTNTQLDNYVKAAYDLWKNNRLKAAPAFTPTVGIYAGVTITDGYYDFANTTSTSATVSEGIGYGMLITAYMAGYDPNAKVYFDGLYKLARGYPAYSYPTATGKYLMDWRLDQGTPLVSSGGGYNAYDGDLDMAYALLMAHRQWGSTGAINYFQQALNTIYALKAANFDTTGVPWAPVQDVSRTSDYMYGHFRQFAVASGDTFWNTAITACQTLITNVIAGYSASAKLTPGWIWHPLTSAAQPSPGGKIEGPYEGNYDQNAVRNPWRWGTHFLFTGDATSKTHADGIVSTIKTSAGSSPTQTTYMYYLNGTAFAGLYYEPTTDGCNMVGAMCGGSQFVKNPVLSTLVTSASGGTLAANTYYYKVTALNANGETIASNEKSVTTTGATSSNTLTWVAATNATSYRVYRGTAAGGENVYYAPGNVTTYVDTNAASTGGSPPTVNTTANAGWQTWLNALFTQIVGNYNVSYYAAELQLLPLIVASNNWYSPAP